MQARAPKPEAWFPEVADLLIEAVELARDQQQAMKESGDESTAARFASLWERYEDLIHRADE